MRRPRTIWDADAIPDVERKYRSLKRFWLPLIDVFYIVAGLGAWRFGVPSIAHHFDEWMVGLWGLTLSTAALAALIGVAFVRLWVLEVVAKLVMLGLIATYVAALISLTRVGEGARGFIAVVAIIATTPLLIRLSIIAEEWATRRARKAARGE